GSTQFKAERHNRGFSHCNQRGHDFDCAFLRPGADHFVESAIVRRTAVWIARTVRLDGSDEHLSRSQDLRPADGDCKKVSVAEGNVRDWDARSHRMRFRYWNAFIRQR